MKSAAPNRRVARCHALIPCAGSGSRAGAGQPKQYQPIGGAPLVRHTLAAFAGVPRIAQTLIVTAPGDDALAARLLDRLPHDAFALADCGGASRAESVFNGLERLLQRGAAGSDWVLVHDAARCLITPALINRLIDACLNAASADEEGGLSGALLAMPLPDTLKAADAAGRAAATLPREGKWLAQTPQMFRIAPLHAALAARAASGFAGITDEASAMEAVGSRPLLVRGSAHNIKVTWPEDFALAAALLQTRHEPA